MKKTTKISLVALVIAIVFVAWMISAQVRSNASQPAVTQPFVMPTDAESYVGTITQDEEGIMHYSSPVYDISFSFTQEWFVGDNHLGYGTFQLLSYDPRNSDVAGKDFMPPHKAKIEMAIVNAPSSQPSSDFPEQNRTSRKTTIAGQNAVVDDISFAGGNKLRVITIALPNPKNPEGKYLSLSAYAGDSDTAGEVFAVQDAIANTIVWK